MADNNFLMIVPPGWTVIPDATNLCMMLGLDGIIDIINRQSWSELEGIIETTGLIPVGYQIDGAKLFDTGSTDNDRIQFWISFVPIV